MSWTLQHLWNVPDAPAEGQIREVGTLWHPVPTHKLSVPTSIPVRTRFFPLFISPPETFKTERFLDGLVVGLHLSPHRQVFVWPTFPPSSLCCVAYLVRLSLPQENVIIPGPSIRWLSFKTCMRKALLHNRSVGACLLVYTMGKRKKQDLKVEFWWVSVRVKPTSWYSECGEMYFIIIAIQTFILK